MHLFDLLKIQNILMDKWIKTSHYSFSEETKEELKHTILSDDANCKIAMKKGVYLYFQC